ncbi:hypothetical protein GDO81_003749 [Engystomops pustulosus]|uniref:Uncharacterized protein n=1 Tax=Engystomops pustulosus TaxID=76066 RepID=A0AAV6ZYU2_ENGPU|nr:hypothetical protein GDO81_003749 [Engystomops pustulosus]
MEHCPSNRSVPGPPSSQGRECLFRLIYLPSEMSRLWRLGGRYPTHECTSYHFKETLQILFTSPLPFASISYLSPFVYSTFYIPPSYLSPLSIRELPCLFSRILSQYFFVFLYLI